MYIVEGGVFSNTNWEEVLPGTEEKYGPFETYDEAKEAWMKHSFTQMLDICTHRLLIKEV